MEELKKHYLKGHSIHRLAQAKQILAKAEKNKHPHIRAVEDSMFWFTIATGIIGSLVLTFAIVPVLVGGTPNQGLMVAGGFGLLTGLLISYITKNMHWLENHHLLAISFVIPIVAMFSFFIAAVNVNALNRLAGLAQHNPVLIGLVYFVTFLVPFMHFHRGKWLKK